MATVFYYLVNVKIRNKEKTNKSTNDPGLHRNVFHMRRTTTQQIRRQQLRQVLQLLPWTQITREVQVVQIFRDFILDLDLCQHSLS